MSRFHWTTETAFQGWTLRDSRGYARSIVTNPKPWVFNADLLQANQPECGPWKTAQQAADWVCRMNIQLEYLPIDSVFGEIPRDRKAA